MTDNESKIRFLLAREELVDRNVELYVSPESVRTFYADGVVSFGFGPGVSRLEFFTTDAIVQKADGSSSESRQVAFRVVLPTQALLETMFSIVDQVRANPSTILSAFDVQKDTTNKLLQKKSDD